MLRTFNRYQDVERSTATARARTAKQFEEFLQPDNVRLFPNLKWLPSRSANPRQTHTAFYNRVWAKDDPFWNTNAPGTEWNCKCDVEETDEPLTDNSALPQPTVPLGLEGNPARTGEVFTDNASYIRIASGQTTAMAIRTCREVFRAEHENDNIHFDTSIGKVLFDNISSQEITKGARTDKSYFYKHEIALHFDKYADLLQPLPPETIDLSHNNHNNIFYRRKAQFTQMRVYILNIHGYSFRIKLGEFADGSLNLYCITEP